MALSFPGYIGSVETSIGAGTAVEKGISKAQLLASEAFEEAQLLINSLSGTGNQLLGIPQIQASLGDVTATVSDFVRPDTPDRPEGLTPNFPDAPPDVTLFAVPSFSIDDIPQFEGETPVINEVAPVARFAEVAPDSPTLPDRTGSIPDVPSKDGLPDPVELRNLTLPEAPDVLVVNFEGAVPEILEAAPNANFDYTEEAYDSTLLSALNAKLLDQVNHIKSTGLNPEIEQQLWDRARERTTAVMDDEIIQISRSISAAGWDEPIGEEHEAIERARQGKISADVAESREIAIKQADLELQNFQFAFGQSVALEGQLINHADNVANRALDAAKYVIEAAINLYELKVNYFNANVELYKTQASVYSDRIRAELTKVEVYKAELEGQKLISELNAQDIENYTSQIQAVVSLFDLYKTELEGVKILLEQDSLTLEVYESEIKGYAEKVRAKSLEYEGYKTQLSGEQIKVEMYKGFADAFESKINGFKSVVDAKVSKLDADIKVNQEIPLEQTKVLNEVFQSQVKAESARLSSLTEVYKSDAEVFDTETKGETARVDAEVKVQAQEIEHLKAAATINLDSLKANVSVLLKKIELLMNAQKTAAQVEAQLASSFGSAVNLSAGISETGTNSRGVSYNMGSSISNTNSESATVSL
jgi:hypothetical protein